MILADTSVWVDYFRGNDLRLAEILDARGALIHPFVLGELMLGGLLQRPEIISDLRALPRAIEAASEEVATFIESHRLHGRGIGYVDAALLASVKLDSGVQLWTRDRKLSAVAVELAIDIN